ncbi:MAG: hypothetical protein EXX96DRAFT_454099, partial [Benjaminiella poitrasii]
ANGKLSKNSNIQFKLDFSVDSTSGNDNCVVLIAKFKPTEKNSYAESDFVKLAKQAKEALDNLIINGVMNPKVCGIQCKGEN